MNGQEQNLEEALLLSEHIHELFFRVWSRNSLFLQKFVTEGQLENIINLLRPKGLDHIPDDMRTIEIRLFQEKEPLDIFDSWPSVLRGLIAKLIADTIRSIPSILNDIISEYPWLADRLLVMIESESVIEKYGALVCLEKIYWSGKVRASADLSFLVPHTIRLIENACDARRGLLNSMRWRLAVWRVSFELIHTLIVIPDLDLNGTNMSEMVPLRRDWRQINNDGKLVVSLLKIFKFAHSCIPQPGEERFATMFSGPGMLKGSGIKVQDLAPTLRSCCHLIKKLTIQDEFSKIVLMKQCDMVPVLKQVGAFFAGATKEDVIDLLIYMGVSNPVSHLEENSIIELLKSSHPRDVLKALKLLGHADHVVDAENWQRLTENMNLTSILMNFMKPNLLGVSFNEKVGRSLIQMDPIRDATTIPANTPWKTVIKAFAAYVLGKQLMFACHPVIHAVSKDLTSLCENAIYALKSGQELERWGMSQFLAGVLVSSSFMIAKGPETIINGMIFAAYKCLTQKEFTLGGFSDIQWRLETWFNATAILFETISLQSKSESRAKVFSDIHQMGVIPALFDLLKEIAQLHGIAFLSETSVKLDSQFSAPKKTQETVPIEYRYRNDHTLSSLVHKIFRFLLLTATSDKFSRDIIMWDSNLSIMETYLHFVSPDVVSLVTNLFEELIIDLKHVPTKKQSKQKSMSRRVSLQAMQMVMKNSRVEEKTWPLHIKQQEWMDFSLNAVYLDESDRHLLLNQRDLLFMKFCGNPSCWNREMRKGQFKQAKTGEWVCCRGCAIQRKPVK